MPKEGVTSSPTDFETAFHDDDGHVTHVAGIIGALGIKGGVVGGMWLSLKCLLLSSNHFLSYKRDPLSYKPFAVNPNSNTFSFHIAKALDDDGVCFCCHFLFAVAGAAALVWSFFPKCSNNQIRINTNIQMIPHHRTGFGLIQAKAAFDLLDQYGCDAAGGKDKSPLSKGVEGGCYNLPGRGSTVGGNAQEGEAICCCI